MLKELDNQAATLRELVRKAQSEPAPAAVVHPVGPAPVRRKQPITLAVTSGKGGVGKTLVSVNLAINFARQGLRVLIIDADLGLANIDVVLGLTPEYTIQDLLCGRKSLDEVAVAGPPGVTILPAASGVAELSNLTEEQRLSLMDHIDHWNQEFDLVLVDTGAGISPNVLYFILAVERILVVVTPDPASITDAYALIKVMFTNHRVDHFDLLVNMAKTPREALEVYRTLHRVADRFLNIGLSYAGMIPNDPMLVRAVRQQRTISELYPQAPASLAFDQLSRELLERWRETRGPEGRMTFFWRRVFDESGG